MDKYLNMLEKENLSKEEFMPVWEEFKKDLNSGKIRVAEKIDENWIVNKWVKQFILLGFKYGDIIEYVE